MPQQPNSTRPRSAAGTSLLADPVAELYDPLVEHGREAFHGSRVVRSIAYGMLRRLELEALLISFCALGVHVTTPVAHWIERSGRACLDRGHHSLGLALMRHAEHEIGHGAMLEADARTLIDHWNRAVQGGTRLGHDRHEPVRTTIDADTLLASSPTEGIRRYVELHESIIDGDSPFAQLAIEYEIEMLSTTLGVALIDRIERLCGPRLLERLTFITHHVELDEGHTAFNRRHLAQFLARQPDAAAVMADAGVRALRAYRIFLADCHRLSFELLEADQERTGR